MSVSEVRFVPDDPARTGRIVLRPPDGAGREEPTPLGMAEAIPLLLRAYRSTGTSASAAAWWGAATMLALDLVGRGRIVPRLSDAGVDEWGVGPIDECDARRLAELEASMPASVRTTLRDGVSGGAVGPLVRAYLDACADTLPRHEDADPGVAYASPEVRPRPELRAWADEARDRETGGMRVLLRVDAAGDEFTDLSVVPCFYRVGEPSALVEAQRLWHGDHSLGTHAPLDALLAVRAAARVWGPLARLLELAVPDRILLSDDETAALVGPAGARLRAAGVEVRWPRDLVTDVRAHARLDRRPRTSTADGRTGDAFELRWQVAVGDEPLSGRELNRLAEATRPVVRLRNQWLVVPEDVLARARDRTRPSLTAAQAVGAALTGRVDAGSHGEAAVEPGAQLAELRDRLVAPEDGDEPLVQPADLRATLRDYQLRGLRWLHRMTSLGLGCCLADDMGLGKTVTVIALHLRRRSSEPGAGPTLVVCPATLMANWEREIDRFAPGTPVRRFHGPTRTLDDLDGGFVLTTYGTMRRDAGRLDNVAWGLVVADEAQHVKNRDSGTAGELRRIGSGVRVALTGTPVENNLDELWAILDWAVPGLLGTRAEFARRYADPIAGARDPLATERLRRLVAPFMLRRHKSDPGIAPELPRKTEIDRLVSLTPEQVGLYEAAVREGMAAVGSASPTDRRGKIFALLTALKQICNHPAQFLHEDAPRLDGRSGKLALLDELVDVIRSEGGATLVFTQYTAMARLLRRHLEARGIATLMLDGRTPVDRRQRLVEEFQAGAAPVFLLSLKAAGVGLNLTRADHVVHFDRWWNPAVEDQATDRAYRIGQTRAVQVHRLVTEGTIEDRIASMLSSKRELSEAVLASGDGALSELSDAELEELVTLRSVS